MPIFHIFFSFSKKLNIEKNLNLDSRNSFVPWSSIVWPPCLHYRQAQQESSERNSFFLSFFSLSSLYPTSISILDPTREGGGQKMAPIRRDMVSLEINVVSGKLAKMHLTFYTNSGDAESHASPHAFSLCLSCSLCPNWSSRSDNPVLSALISSQACLSITDWSQMALLGKDVSSFYQKDRRHHASPKPKRST